MEASTKIVKFITRGAGVLVLGCCHIFYILKMHYSLENLLLNLTKVRPLFTLSHRGSDNSRLLIVFSANNIDQSIGYFYATEIIHTKFT